MCSLVVMNKTHIRNFVLFILLILSLFLKKKKPTSARFFPTLTIIIDKRINCNTGTTTGSTLNRPIFRRVLLFLVRDDAIPHFLKSGRLSEISAKRNRGWGWECLFERRSLIKGVLINFFLLMKCNFNLAKT